MEKRNNICRVLKPMAAVSTAMLLWSCQAEEPFHAENEGTSLVKFNVSMNSNVTRAETTPEESCVIYISNEKGLLHKWTGVNNIPSGGVYLRYGSYRAEAFAGDSVPASFSTKYLKGKTDFEVSQNQISTQVIVDCKLANVVASVDVSELQAEIAKNIKVEVKSSTGDLTFQNDDLSNKGYFMRAYNETSGTYDDELSYTVTGYDTDGTQFTKSGTISNVLPAHEYKIVLKGDNSVDEIGGAALQIIVREYELMVDDTVIIHGQPEFSWVNNEISIDGQLYNKDQSFSDKTIVMAAYDKFESLVLSTENETVKNALGGVSMIDLVSSAASEKEKLKASGIEVEAGKNGVYEQFSITFSANWLNSLPSAPKEYVLNIMTRDSRGIGADAKIRIATSEEALDAPFAINGNHWKENLLSIRAHKAEVAVNLYDRISGLSLRYKKTEDSNWEEMPMEGTMQKGSYIYTLTGLEDNTSYDVQLVAGALSGDKYQFESNIENFKTEEEFIIPNASMENWWLYNRKIWMPNFDSNYEFWDSGNHGATAIGDENDNLTTQFTEFYHSNGSCARLQSKFVGILSIGKLGSGNIFSGKYAGTSGTNGKIDFGREYNASHPSKLRVWVNYRPKAAVNRKGANNNYIKEGELDQGQIYIALSDEIKRVDTSDQSTLVTEDRASSLFLAYGQQTFVGDYGDDKQLKMVEIDFNYFDKAKTVAPKYLIIVCCASKYGDYFSGGDGSLMYVDDFELVYE